MKKITVNKSDEVAVIVEKIIESDATEITLDIPKFSHLGESLSNFHLLKREADAIGKNVFVESVDDHIIELAELSGLSAVNPFFAKSKKQFSDIVMPKTGAKIGKRKIFLEKREKPDKEEKLEKEEKSIEERFDALEKSYTLPPKPKLRIFSLPKFSFNFPKWRLKFQFSKRRLGLLLVVGCLLFVGVAAAKILPKADVKIVAKKQNWLYQDSVLADKAAVLDVEKMSISGQVFSQKKNVSLKFPASGRRQVEKYASGSITVYNGYSSDPQTLVEKTRFVSPDGKLFRLTKTILVPGAKIVDGKIVPSSIPASVIADTPGPDYNIGPVKLFTIPGFKGTPKYQAFYGESIENMSGGFIGEIAYPTPDDIKKAKIAAEESLASGLKTALLAQVPQEFKILDNAISYKIISQKVDEEADQDKNFSIFTEAEIKLTAFKESDLKELLQKRAIRDNGEEFEVKNYDLEYGLARVDLEKGKISFPVKFSVVLVRKINVEELKSKLAGKTQNELEPVLFSLPGFDSGTVSTWPFWVSRVPKDLNKISVTVE